MPHPAPSINRGFHLLLVVIAILTLLVGSGAGLTPEPQEPPTPAEIRAEDWKALPVPGRLAEEAQTAGGSANAANMVCYNEGSILQIEHKLRTTVAAREVFTNYPGNWEIKVGNLCELDFNPTIGSSAFAEFSPRLSFDTTRVVFVSNRSGSYDIFTADLSDKVGKQLTSSPATDIMPAYSPHGMIAFVSDRTGSPEIYTMNGNGSNQTALTSNQNIDVFPDWSPDGRRIAFLRADGAWGQFFVMDANGGRQRALTARIYLPGKIRWSPSGTRLVFEYDQNGDGWIDLGIVNADGTGIRPFLMAATSLDYDLGSWDRDEDFIAFSKITYLKDNSGWYANRGQVLRRKLTSSWEEVLSFDSGFHLNVDIRNPDRQPPVSGLLSPPVYQRAGSIALNWWARDRGAAGLRQVWVDYSRNGGAYSLLQYAGSWSGITEVTGAVSPPGFTTYPGEVYDFKTNALDMTGNIEPQKTTPDARIYIYQHQVTGSVLDVRGKPLAGVQVGVISPTPNNAINVPKTGLDGSATLYFKGSGAVVAGFSRAGLPDGDPQTWTVDGDRSFLTVMRGMNERVTNGQFNPPENPFSGWEITGQGNVSAGAGWLDGQSVRFQPACVDTLCLTEGEAAGEATMIVVDSLGQAHTLTRLGIYRVRGTDGTWQDGQALPVGSYQALTLGAADELMAVQDAPGAKLYRKPSGGTWSATNLPAGLHSASLAVDEQGRVRLVYQAKNQTLIGDVYYTHLANGQWLAPTLLATGNNNFRYPQISLDGQGNAVVLSGLDSTIQINRLNPDGQPVSQQQLTLPRAAQTVIPNIRVDASGNWHILARAEEVDSPQANPRYNTVHYYYWFCSSAGSCGNAVEVFPANKTLEPYNNISYGGLEIDDQGVAHLFFLNVPDGGQGNLIHAAKLPGVGPFFIRNTTLPYTPERLSLALAGSEQAHLLVGSPEGSRLYQSNLVGAPEWDGVKQSISLPAGMHAPTLSFFYRLEGASRSAETGLEVFAVREGQEPVSVIKLVEKSDKWTHAWADLSPWLGQEVTLEFRLMQAAGEYPTRLFVDEVTVSEWRTPVFQSISPNFLQRIPPEGAWIRLHGENLMSGSQVFVGERQAAETQHDTQTGDLLARITLPMPFGAQDVRVVAPGGQDETLPKALRIGSPLYLGYTIKGYQPE